MFGLAIRFSCCGFITCSSLQCVVVALSRMNESFLFQHSWLTGHHELLQEPLSPAPDPVQELACELDRAIGCGKLA